MVEMASDEGPEKKGWSRFGRAMHRKSNEKRREEASENAGSHPNTIADDKRVDESNDGVGRDAGEHQQDRSPAAEHLNVMQPVDLFKSGLVSPLERDVQLGDKEDEGFKAEAGDKEEDIDIALPVTEMRPFGYILNLLSSAPSASSISASLKKLKQQYLFSGDRLYGEDGGKRLNPLILTYGSYEDEIESQEEETIEPVQGSKDEKEDQNDDKTLNGLMGLAADAEETNDGDRTLNESKKVDSDIENTQGNTEHDGGSKNMEIYSPSLDEKYYNDSERQNESASSKKSDLDNESAGSTASNNYYTKDRPNDDVHEIDMESLSVFQKSIVEKLNPHSISESMFGRLKESRGVGEEKKNRFEKQYNELKLKIAKKLQNVFDLDNDDIFYGNFDTWLVKDVLLQGHLYLTRDSFLFFAFLPRRFLNSSGAGRNTIEDDSEFIVQSGSLGLKTAKYGETVFNTVITHRFWAVLGTETLSIYSSPTDLYFPKLIIDLKSCIKVEIMDKPIASTKISNKYGMDGISSPRFLSRKLSSDSLDNEDEPEGIPMDHDGNIDDYPEGITGGVWFKLYTKKKNYRFYTDNLYVARQWYSNITKSIFQINNSNSKDEVLIKIPIENILDYKRVQLFDGNESDEEDDETVKKREDPTSISIRYYMDQDNEDDYRLSSTKERWKRNIKTGTGYGDVEPKTAHIRLLFFAEMDKFQASLDEVLSKNVKVEQPESIRSQKRSERFIKKAIRTMGREPLAENRPQYRKFFSTLTSSPNESAILDQISKQNEAMKHLKPTGCGNERSDDTLASGSMLKSFGKNIAHPSKMFSKKGDEPSSGTHSSSLSPEMSKSVEVSSLNFEDGVLSNSLFLTGLRNMQMYFQKSEKDVCDAEIESKNDVQSSYEGDPEQKNDIFSETETISGPLLLSEPSDVAEDIKGRENKLTSIKNGLKSISGVSGMFTTTPYHYHKLMDDDLYFVDSKESREIANINFRRHFSLGERKTLASSYYVHLSRSFPVYGKLYLGNEELCFRSLLPGVSTMMVLPLKDIEQCWKDKGIKIANYRLVVRLKRQEELNFEFGNTKSRDDFEMMLLKKMESLHSGENWKPKAYEWGQNHDPKIEKRNAYSGSSSETAGSQSDSDVRLATLKIERARLKMFEDRVNSSAGLDVPIILEDSPFIKTEIKPSTSYRFTLLTIGSRGDVQPYIALGKGLLAEGHQVVIASHAEFKEWVMKHGMQFKEIAGDPAELMSLMVTHGSMSVSFLKEASTRFRGWIQELLKTSWEACQDTDILIESPSAMGGLHIAEALGIPYMRAFTMPWTRTRAYPHAFIVPDQKKGGSYNYLTHVMFETVFWKGISGQINRWRVKDLGLPRTNLNRMQQTKVPFLYNISPTIFPPSVDFPDWVKVTGYWFLDEAGAADFEPPPKLVRFLEQAYEDGKKIVYIGFGSIVVNDARKMTKAVVEAVLDADVRCVLNKGWSDRLNKDHTEPEIDLPPEVFSSGTISHDWLFPRIDAAVHHGGSGTTGATMRAGLPTAVKPFFGDQFFYASRLEEIGAGLALRKLNAHSLSKALRTITSDARMIEKASQISERIKHENGVMSAVESIYSELEYARSLILAKQLYNEAYQHSHGGILSGVQTPVIPEGEEEEYSEFDEDVNFDDALVEAAAKTKIASNSSITMLSSKKK